MDEQHSVAGGWLGTYTYRGTQSGLAPVRFEATLAESDKGRFSGTVLDDGPGGEARVTGTQNGQQVRFTKIYVARGTNFALPVTYSGTLSEDGMFLTGKWRILTCFGTWEARRLWTAQSEQEDEADTKTATRELVAAGT